MANPLLLPSYCFVFLLAHALHFEANAELTGPLIRHLSSILKWTGSSTRSPALDVDVVQFEDGYLMETAVEGKHLGVLPHSVHVSQDGDLFAIDSINSKIVRINTPLSQYSRARSVAGSSQGRIGHVDGKSSDARFNRPKGLTLDDSGNIYVADTANGAIRKIRDGGVTTIAGGKSSSPGYRDGPSEQAIFSNDFDIVYVRHMCSLIVIDRGNAALRQILLNREDCDYRDNSVSFPEAMMVVGAILAGYLLSALRLHLGTFLPKTMGKRHEACKDGNMLLVPENTQNGSPAKVKGGGEASDMDEEVDSCVEWPSPGRLIVDLGKQAVETMAGFFSFSSRLGVHIQAEADGTSLHSPKKGPLPPFTTMRDGHPSGDSSVYTDRKTDKVTKSSSKEEAHHSPADPNSRSRGHKERSRHRQREKSWEMGRSRVVDPRTADTATSHDMKLDNSGIRIGSSRHRHVDSFRF